MNFFWMKFSFGFPVFYNRGFQFIAAPTGTQEIVGFHFAGTGIRLAQAGYAVFGLDVEGHGKSDGLQAYIPSFNNIVDDTISYFKSVRGLFIHLLNPSLQCCDTCNAQHYNKRCLCTSSDFTRF